MEQDQGERLAQAAKLAVDRLSGDGAPTTLQILKAKQEAARLTSSPKIPRNSDLLKVTPADAVALRTALTTKPTRGLSGVVVISAITAPMECPPQAKCIFCPGGVRMNTPQSYTGDEPATKRGAELRYDPYLQTTSRLHELQAMGHETGKVELIALGGTFLYLPESYQRWFIKGLYDGLNGFRSSTLEEAISKNERAARRCVGLTIETRPDFMGEREARILLGYGTTRVEIGVQSLNEEVLRRSGRGHGVKEVVQAFEVARAFGFKIVAHMMPGLPGADVESDLESFKLLFEDQRFRPDMLKIYPTLVTEGTPLSRLYARGAYTPYDDKVAVELLAKVMAMTPPWVRIMRVQREIPSRSIIAGPKSGNLRELAEEELRRSGRRCMCIRCREVGSMHPASDSSAGFRLKESSYTASNGVEVFLSIEDGSRLAAFLRLRAGARLQTVDGGTQSDSCVVRELRVYGRVAPLGVRTSGFWQHKGLGRGLLYEAERISEERYGARRLFVISAVGTREYYQKLGYRRVGAYMCKELSC
jgi:elongator complex protein 3